MATKTVNIELFNQTNDCGYGEWLCDVYATVEVEINTRDSSFSHPLGFHSQSEYYAKSARILEYTIIYFGNNGETIREQSYEQGENKDIEALIFSKAKDKAIQHITIR